MNYRDDKLNIIEEKFYYPIKDSNNAIEVEKISKVYKIYKNEREIFKDIIFKKKTYKKHSALNNVSFKIKKGETYGVLGSNGSGKSTLLSIINGTMLPSKGKVRVNGQVTMLNVSAGILQTKTGIENIYYKCILTGMKRSEVDKIVDDIIEFSELNDFIYEKVSKYSAGMRAKLGFSIAIHMNPDIFIIDEALGVGDMNFRKKCNNKIKDLQKQGTTILFVSHSVSAVKTICKRALWIEQGTMVGEGNIDQFADLYTKYIRKQKSLIEVKEELKGKL